MVKTNNSRTRLFAWLKNTPQNLALSLESTARGYRVKEFSPHFTSTTPVPVDSRGEICVHGLFAKSLVNLCRTSDGHALSCSTVLFPQKSDSFLEMKSERRESNVYVSTTFLPDDKRITHVVQLTTETPKAKPYKRRVVQQEEGRASVFVASVYRGVYCDI